MCDDNLKNALFRCATGSTSTETVEEFSIQDGELKLFKRKVTSREIPPDLKAVRMLLEGGDDDLDELINERERLENLLKEIGDE